MKPEDLNVVLNVRIRALERMLRTCREEFCWHGNTGQTLSQRSYSELVDKIDTALGPQQPDAAEEHGGKNG